MDFQDKRDLKILELWRELIRICKGSIKKEWTEAGMTEGARRRLRRKIQEGHRDVTNILRELEELQNTPLG